jgi:iron complex transport system permease protein
MNKSQVIWMIVLLVGVLGLFLLEIILGPVTVPIDEIISIIIGEEPSKPQWKSIVLSSRIPRASTALAAGAMLAWSGVLMQTLFRNALAGPSVLGITSGASLGVAVMTMLAGALGWFAQSTGIRADLAVVSAAMIGSFAVLALVLVVSSRLRDSVTLLIFGLMVGYITSAVVSILQFEASSESLRSFIMWGMGTFSNVRGFGLVFMISIGIVGLIASVFLVRSLNLLLLGESYASSMGVRVKRLRLLIIVITGLLAGCITAYCGPIAFLGLAIPHLARGLFKTSDHRVLLPAVVLIGAFTGMFCDLVSIGGFGGDGLPLNAVTSIIGAPVVIYMIFRRRNLQSYL